MSVSFTPGPHPDAATRSASSSSFRPPNSTSISGSGSHGHAHGHTPITPILARSASNPGGSDPPTPTPKSLDTITRFKQADQGESTNNQDQNQNWTGRESSTQPWTPNYPDAPQSSPHSSAPTPLTSSAIHTTFSTRYPHPRFARDSDPDTDAQGQGGDLESQPLLGRREGYAGPVSSTMWPVVLALGGLMAIVALLALGGWRLGAGEGGGRWPGGPA